MAPAPRRGCWRGASGFRRASSPRTSASLLGADRTAPVPPRTFSVVRRRRRRQRPPAGMIVYAWDPRGMSLPSNYSRAGALFAPEKLLDAGNDPVERRVLREGRAAAELLLRPVQVHGASKRG